MVSSQISSATSSQLTELEECGWRVVVSSQPDGTTIYEHIPLRPEEFIHPQEGYRFPNSTFHETITDDAKDMLGRRYANNPTIGVFGDLIIKWDIPNLGDHCPDIFLAFNVQNPEQNRSEFIIANEGTRPALIIEVVSPCYRKQDWETKVVQYARAKVQEYIIIDRRTQRQQVLEEVLGYRLVSEYYQPITPDAEGRILCETVGLWVSLREGRLRMEDVETNEQLKTSVELQAAQESAQQRRAEMEAVLTQYKERFGDLS